MRTSKVLLAVTVAAVAAIGASALVSAQDVIAQRKALMKATGGSFKTATDMVKGETPYDAAKAAEAMTKIAKGMPDFLKLFPDNAKTGGETTAAPAIWEKRADFDAKGAAMVKAVEAAAAAAPKGLDAFKTAHAEIGKTCGGCHTPYRIKK